MSLEISLGSCPYPLTVHNRDMLMAAYSIRNYDTKIIQMLMSGGGTRPLPDEPQHPREGGNSIPKQNWPRQMVPIELKQLLGKVLIRGSCH